MVDLQVRRIFAPKSVGCRCFKVDGLLKTMLTRFWAAPKANYNMRPTAEPGKSDGTDLVRDVLRRGDILARMGWGPEGCIAHACGGCQI